MNKLITFIENCRLYSSVIAYINHQTALRVPGTISETNENVLFKQFKNILIIKIKQKLNIRLYSEVFSIKVA